MRMPHFQKREHFFSELKLDLIAAAVGDLATSLGGFADMFRVNSLERYVDLIAGGERWAIS
jgi:hypothetical protein